MRGRAIAELTIAGFVLTAFAQITSGQGFEIMGSSEGLIFGKTHAAISYDVKGVLPSRSAEPWFATLYNPPNVTIITDPPLLRPEGITFRNGLLYVSGDWNETQNQVAVFSVNSWGDLSFYQVIQEPLATPPPTTIPNNQWWGPEGITFNTGPSGIGAGASTIVSVENQQQGVGNTLAEVDPTTGAVTNLSIAPYPEDICYAPASQRFYLVVRSPNEMLVFDSNMSPLGISWVLPSRTRGVAVVSEAFGRALTGDNSIIGEVVLAVSAENTTAIPPLPNRMTAYTSNGTMIGATINLSWVDLSYDNSSQGGTVPGPHTFQGIAVDEANHVIYIADDGARAVYSIKPFTNETASATGPIVGQVWRAQGVYVKTVLPSRSGEPWYPSLAGTVSNPPRLAPEGMTILNNKLYVSGDWNETQNQVAAFSTSPSGGLTYDNAIQSPITNPPPSPTTANAELWGPEGLTFNTSTTGYGASASFLVACEDAQFLMIGGTTRSLLDPITGVLSSFGTFTSIVGAASPDDIAYGPADSRFYVIADPDVLQVWTNADPPVYAGTQFALSVRSKGLAVISQSFTRYLLNDPLLTGDHLLVVAKSLVQSTSAPHNRLVVYSTTGILRSQQDLFWTRDAFPGAPLQEFEAVAVDEANKVIYIGDEQAHGIFVLTPQLPLSISTTSPLPTGNSGLAYSQSISATGGSTPYGFTLVSGSLPAGLSLSAGGSLSGIPTSCGQFGFTVQVQDSSVPVQGESRAFVVSISSSLPAGDVSQDSIVNGEDVQRFIAAYLDPGSGLCGADMDANFLVDDNDIPLFVSALLSQ